jgi:transposase
MLKSGTSADDVAKIIGCGRATVYTTKDAYDAHGENSFIVKKRGAKYGQGRYLSAEQEESIREKIKEKCPDQLDFDFALWTRGAVRELIKRETGVELSPQSVGVYLARWNYTPQKPVKYSYERSPAAVKKWLDDEYPAIKEAAKAEKAEIYWEDETGLQSNDVRGRGYAPVGKTPAIKVSGKRERINMLSAISNKGKVHWMLREENTNTAIFLEFIMRLMVSIPGKIYLILDNLKVHHNKEMCEWLEEEHSGKIKLFYLPSYSPDLNPDEHLNADVKQGVGAKAPVRTKDKLWQAAENHMKMLDQTPQRICKYFDDPAINYAANV